MKMIKLTLVNNPTRANIFVNFSSIKALYPCGAGSELHFTQDWWVIVAEIPERILAMIEEAQNLPKQEPPKQEYWGGPVAPLNSVYLGGIEEFL